MQINIILLMIETLTTVVFCVLKTPLVRNYRIELYPTKDIVLTIPLSRHPVVLNSLDFLVCWDICIKMTMASGSVWAVTDQY